VIVKTKQQSGTILSQQPFVCRLAPPSVRRMAWDALQPFLNSVSSLHAGTIEL